RSLLTCCSLELRSSLETNRRLQNKQRRQSSVWHSCRRRCLNIRFSFFSATSHRRKETFGRRANRTRWPGTHLNPCEPEFIPQSSKSLLGAIACKFTKRSLKFFWLVPPEKILQRKPLPASKPQNPAA